MWNTRIMGLTLVAALAATPTVSAAPKGAPAAVGGQAVLSDVRTGGHPSFDRLVVEFRKGFPGYDVRYKKVLRSDGSGQKVELKGRKNVQIRLEPARAHTDRGGHPTLSTNGEVVGLPQIKEWALIGDFEAVVTIGIGVKNKSGFTVTELRHPRRLVVDLAH